MIPMFRIAIFFLAAFYSMVDVVETQEMDENFLRQWSGSLLPVFEESLVSKRSTLEKPRVTKYAVSSSGTVQISWPRSGQESRLKNHHIHIFSNRRKRNLVPSRILITHHFNEKLVSPGEDISLQCSASSDRPPRFLWERDGVVITSNTEQRYTLGQMMTSSGISVTSHLNISRVRVEDGGMYSCTAVEGDSTVAHGARIDVFGPPYIRSLPPIKVQSGEPLKLKCPYYGYPISKLEWEHKGKKIVSTTLPQHGRYRRHSNTKEAIPRKVLNRTKKQILDTNDNGILNLPRVTKEENGETYTCVVYSPSGEMARRSFEIQVVEAPELDELRVGTGLKEGQIVQITCNIVGGDPPIYFSWLKDGKKIPPILKITERSSDLFSVLIIKRVSLEHCGKYSCIATNHVGKTNQTAELYINVAPKWIDEPVNTSLLLGQRGVVYCNANGYPTPQIHWMKRDATLGIWRPVLDLAGGGVMSLTNGTLIIEVVSLSDEGMYACNVENGVGEPLNKNFWISVNKPVHFESPSTNLTTKVGLRVMLSCFVLGDTPIRIKWTLNAAPLDFTSSKISVSETAKRNGVNSVLNINFVETRDGGVYECRASNPYGVATHTIHLSILEPPTPPLDLQVDSISSRSVKLSWKDIIKTHVQYYNVQYTTNDFSNWDTAKSINITRQNHDVRQSIELRDLQPAQDYKVRVASGNQVDLSHYTQPLHFTMLLEAPSSAPLSIQVQPTDSPGELQVAWMPPPSESLNGPLQGFHVRAVPRISGDVDDIQTKIVKVIARKGKHETLLTGLLKNTRYAVSVSAFNAAGNGPYSMPVYQTTREGAPEVAPSSVECRGVSSTSLRVAWQPIVAQGSSLLGYYIYYSDEDGPWQNITSPHTEVYLQALLKYTNYTIKIAGFSNYGIGPFSLPILCATLQDVPGPPSAIKVVVTSSSSLMISWKKPNFPNGEITHYTIYIKPSSSTNAPQTYRVEPKPVSNLPTRHMTFEVKNLSEGNQYEVYVSASTRAGEGAATHTVHTELTGRVVAGVWSLGGTVSAGAGSSLHLSCASAGTPPPRAEWYHHHYIITHHPRYTRRDDSLIIDNIDQSLSGNYTCLAKNLYGSDSVSYTIIVLPTPESPRMIATPHRNALHLSWDHPKGGKKISYNLTWKEAAHSWQDAWSSKTVTVLGVQEYTIEGLKCGTKYSIKITASNSVGSSLPAFLDATTLGGIPKPPSTSEWFWSNSTHIYIQLSGWDDTGCEITGWLVEYREYGNREWKKAENRLHQQDNQWNYPLNTANSFVIADLVPGQWYYIRVHAHNIAGTATSIYSYATTTVTGETIGPPADYFDIHVVVIAISTVLVTVCILLCIFVVVKKQNTNNDRFVEYRNSLDGATLECKSERSNITANTPQSVSEANRVYSTPIHLPPDSKHELYEISPYAQFAIGFRTFGHVENQEAPRLPGAGKSRYHSETSFQVRSESEESDSVSRTTTLKSAPRKTCRVPHHRSSLRLKETKSANDHDVTIASECCY